MKLHFPVIELVDRYAIAIVKFERTNGMNHEELDFYQHEIDSLPHDIISDGLAQLVQIHQKIWTLETELKNDREKSLPLEEIGRRAIAIRDWNKKRIAIKNLIADRLDQDPVREIKKEHLSE